MSKQPRVSVIIPTYNRAEHLPAALDSVLDQEGVDDLEYEVIVIDDGSTDETAEVMEKYKDRVIYERLPENTGRPAVVRNKGMRMARGELIAFEDSDDVWVKDKFAAQLSAFDDPSVVLSYGNCGFITPDGKVIPNKTAIYQAIPVNGYAFTQKVSRVAAPTPTPSVMLRRSVMEKIGLFNEKLIIATDTDYFIRVATLGEFRYVDKVLVYMRRDGSNISARPDETGDEALFKHELNRVDMFKHIREEIELTPDEKATLDYRIVELKRELADIAPRLNKEAPFEVKDLKLPPKPKSLQEIEDRYDRAFAYGRVDKVLKALIGWFPPLYLPAKRLARKGVKWIRKVKATQGRKA